MILSRNKLFLKLSFLLFFYFFLAAEINAQGEIFSLGGYAKYLPSYVEYPNIDKNLADHLLHIRLNTRWYPTENLTGALEFRFRAYQGDSKKNIPGYKQLFFSSDYEFSQLSWYLWETDNSLGYLQIDRVWAEYFINNFQITAGRQRIAWGTALVWNITDIFNPLNILDFDYEERPGTDAIRLQYFPSALSSFDLVIKPAASGDKTIAAVKISFNEAEYDIHLIFGKKEGRYMGGFSFAGDIRGAGFRGEFTLTEKADPASNLANQFDLSAFNPYLKDNSPNFAGVLSGDYTFSSSLYLHAEAIYNSNGRSENLGVLQFFSTDAGMLSPSRWELFQEISYNITPLFRGSLFVIFNPMDCSRIWVPSFSYNLSDNWDLYLIGLLAEGENLTEYGNYGKSVYLRLKYSF